MNNNGKREDTMKERDEEKNEKNTLDEIWGNMDEFIDALFEHHKTEMSLGHYLR